MIEDTRSLRRFLRHIEHFITDLDPEVLPRWRVIKGSVQVWSLVMREDGETKEDAPCRAWNEFMKNCTGEELSDLLLWRMADALTGILPEQRMTWRATRCSL